MDETTAPVLDPGRGRTKTGFLWTLARDDRNWGGADPPGVVYFYAPDRRGENAETFLTGFDGILQIDGYSGYNRLSRPSRKGGAPITVAHCWAHARRKLREVFDRDGSEIAAEGLRRIAEFYQIEAEIRGTSPGQRLSARAVRTAPLIESFREWLTEARSRVSAKSRLGEKLGYIHRHWDGLQTFLTNGRVEIDSNGVENLIRPIALNRKNALFAGHDEGGKAWGRIASLIETAKINDVEPFAYLKATLEAIAQGHPKNHLDELLPWNFAFSVKLKIPWGVRIAYVAPSFSSGSPCSESSRNRCSTSQNPACRPAITTSVSDHYRNGITKSASVPATVSGGVHF